jgi:cysteine sulfinate desulfinase/cysteine desulfurase-like protein
MEEEEIRITNLKTQDDVVKQLVKKECIFLGSAAPFIPYILACAFERTPEIEREIEERRVNRRKIAATTSPER